jgi:hypothetical protein
MVSIDESILCVKRQGREFYRFNIDEGMPIRILPVKAFSGGIRIHVIIIIS